MQYRNNQRLNIRLSTFGIGCMRLPLAAQPDGKKDTTKIDQDAAIRMIRKGIDAGVNYLDTAYPYHGGQSELLVAKALRDGYRDKVHLATKLPIWAAKSAADFDRLLNEQLEKLETECIEFYLLHAINQERWEFLKQENIFQFLDQAKKDGRIRYTGFSFHDQLPLFKEVIDSYDWDMTQIQYNILDENYQAGREGLKYAADKGLLVVVMEPLRGGSLAGSVPTDIQAVWDRATTRRSPAEWAFRWLIDEPQIGVVLSGVSTMAQLEDNIRIFSQAEAGSLSRQEHDLIRQVQELYRSKIKVDCTRCNYCMPCPHGVSIPGVFRLYNNMSLFEAVAKSKQGYQGMLADGDDASKCVACGQCEPLCPQNISIIEKLAEAHQALQ